MWLAYFYLPLSNVFIKRLFIYLVLILLNFALFSGEQLPKNRSQLQIQSTDAQPLFELLDWDSPILEAFAVAWGDIDNDGDLDLAVGNGNFKMRMPNQIYINEDGILKPSSWSPVEINDITYAVAWGDYDNDGDLDLAVGNGCDPFADCDHAHNRVYQNDNGQLGNSAIWSSPENNLTMSLEWGDYDGDNDLDLIAGNGAIEENNAGNLIPTGAANVLYENQFANNPTEPFVQKNDTFENDEDFTISVSWVDFDQDGDLDLLVGNGEAQIETVIIVGFIRVSVTITLLGPNQLYINENNQFNLALELEQPDDQENPKLTTSTAWGDYDNDGDLDLAVGNSSVTLTSIDGTYIASPRGYPNLVYQNNGLDMDGVPQLDLVWVSADAETTVSTQWGDYNGDGFLDLAAGNTILETNDGTPQPDGRQTRLYKNDNGSLLEDPETSLTEEDLTRSVAWGDFDADGDVDLVSAGANLDSGQPIRLYRNNTVMLIKTPIWPDEEIKRGYSVAWGDYDNDGDLDLAVGNNGAANDIYENIDGELIIAQSTWGQSNDALRTRSVAWGDVDGDYDLDLAIGNFGQPNQLFINEEGTFNLSPWMGGGVYDNTYELAWGDYDNDGDLDLAVANYTGKNYVYLNDAGSLSLVANWMSDNEAPTSSVAWGDYDRDGDLDLAFGNIDAQNEVYRNDGFSDSNYLQMTLVWSPESILHDTHSVAWGDVDGDGYPELAIGNHGEKNRVYENNEGTLSTTNYWESIEADNSFSVVWGDYDSDGDLDLAVGNGGATTNQPNKLYRNERGVLQTRSEWPSSNDAQETRQVAWGDIDNDGDLDLVGANDEGINALYINPRRQVPMPGNQPTFVQIQRPGLTPDAYGFSSSEIIKAEVINIPYTLYDEEGDIASSIIAEFSLNGGGTWQLATPTTETAVQNLATAPYPQGVQHTYQWLASADMIKSDEVVFRIRALSPVSHGDYHWPAYGAHSPLFRVEALPLFARLVNESGQTIAGAELYVDGEIVRDLDGQPLLSNQQGLIPLKAEHIGSKLVALTQVDEQDTERGAHDQWAYRTYLTNLPLNEVGDPLPYTISEAGVQTLVLKKNTPLILFNIVVSVEWEADSAYLDDLETAFNEASRYLYDASDGQMAFGQVTIYDDRMHWSDADFQILAKNIVRPHAIVGGILAQDTTHSIRVGRFWNGTSGNEGSWVDPNGFRTLIHEFGHYALYLYDEYYVRNPFGDIEGCYLSECVAACADPTVGPYSPYVKEDPFPEEPDNASIMYYQYKASEFADIDRWTINCRLTEQARLNNGESDWQTIFRHYSGDEWVLNTPSSRGYVMVGPEVFPTNLMPFPNTNIVDIGFDDPSLLLTVVDEQGNRFPKALVALYTASNQGTFVIDQGLTEPDGEIDILGASPNDMIQAASLDGAYFGEVKVGPTNTLTLTLLPTGLSNRLTTGQSGYSPHLVLIPSSQGDDIRIDLKNAPPSIDTLDAFVIPAEGAGAPNLFSFSELGVQSGYYTADADFPNPGSGSGQLQILDGSNNDLSLSTHFNQQRIFNDEGGDVSSEDGNFSVHLEPNSLNNEAESLYFLVNSTGNIPGGHRVSGGIVGSAYNIRASGAAVQLVNPGTLTMYFHPEVVDQSTGLGIYFWEPDEGVWIPLGGEVNQIDHSITTTIDRLGIYMLGRFLSTN